MSPTYGDPSPKGPGGVLVSEQAIVVGAVKPLTLSRNVHTPAERRATEPTQIVELWLLPPFRRSATVGSACVRALSKERGHRIHARE